jgi:hypothetical protein
LGHKTRQRAADQGRACAAAATWRSKPSDLAASEISPVKKTLRFDSADHPGIVGKTEGMALMGDGALAIVNVDDFGVTGGRTPMAVVRGTGIARR